MADFLRESLGLALRNLKGLPTFTLADNPYKITKGERIEDMNSRTEFLLTRKKVSDFLEDIQDMSLAYPPSQQLIVKKLAAVIINKINAREELLFPTKATAAARKTTPAFKAKKPPPPPPPPRTAPASEWREKLNISRKEHDPATIKKAYFLLARKAHPDRGGSNAAMAEVNVAFDQAKKELGF